jgi:hypothetical protein
MESSTRTEELEAASEPAAPDAVTTEVHPSVTTAIREQCSACGAAMASDQRYCVECGQRRGPARVPMMDGVAQRPREDPSMLRTRRRPRMSVDSTLIAGIGTLLLALGIGVLIGRSGNGSTKSPRVEVVTVAGGGGASSGAAAAPTTTTPTSSSGATPTKSGASHGASRTTSQSKKTAAAPPKTVTVGTPGHGPGYQNGHFTGNFFGE